MGNGLQGDDTFWLVAEHGDRCAFVLNLRQHPRVRVCVAGRWYDGTAEPRPDDDPLDRRRQIDQANGVIGLLDGIIFRSSATTPMSIHIRLSTSPPSGVGVVVGEGGLEPPRPEGHWHLKPARLPIPPLARVERRA